MRRLLCAFLASIFCTAALSAECPIGYTPAQYVQLEYITNMNQTSVIYTGIVMTEGNYVFKTKITPLQGISGGASCIGGNIVTSNTPRGLGYGFFAGTTANGKIVPTIANITFGAANGIPYPNSMMGTTVEFTSEYDNTNKILSISDSNHTYTTSVTGNPVWNVEFLLFNGSTTPLDGFIGRMYYATLIKNGITILNMIPAMRLGDGKPGMYDKVSGNFFTNAGTGEFIAGPSAGKLLGTDTDNCAPCPMNTYKDFVGNAECTPCPDTLISPSGSKSVSECGRVLHVGDKIYHMKSVKQTSPALHIRDENGNVWYGNLYSE